MQLFKFNCNELSMASTNTYLPVTFITKAECQ